MLVSQLETPALILDMDPFERNIRRMKEFADGLGIALRPHYKSHKCTTIAHLQIAAGAKGLCCAKVSEAVDLVQAGIEDVLVANQVVDPAKIARVATLAGCCRLTVCVDDERNARDLNAAASVQNTVIHCLVEYDIGMNRCGVATYEDCLALARRIEAAPHLVFEGIQAYAGHLAHEDDEEKRRAYSEGIEQDLRELKRYLEGNGLAVKEISGVSTGTAFMRPKGSVYTEIQAGSYIFMDASYNALNLAFENALFVLSSVVSARNGRIVFDAGAKSFGMDQRPPVFLDHPETAIRFNEEHCSIPEGACGWRTGDKARMIPGHCCTTVNLYDFIHFVRKEKVVDRVPVTSRGKNL